MIIYLNNEIRKQALSRRDQLPQRKDRSMAIARQLLSFLDDKKMTGIYIPIRSEADLYSYLSHLPNMAAPRLLSSTEMEMDVCKNLKPSGKYQIPEPQNMPEAECSILLIPMAAFSGMARIGYGAGYYDRYLHAHSDILRCGTAFEIQKDTFEKQPWDELMDLIVTEETIYANSSPESLDRMKRYFGKMPDQAENWIWVDPDLPQDDKTDGQ